MLILEIALGIILAGVIVAGIPLLLAVILGVLVRTCRALVLPTTALLVCLTKPRSGLFPVPQTRREWAITSLLQVGGVFGAFCALSGVLSLAGHFLR